MGGSGLLVVADLGHSRVKLHAYGRGRPRRAVLALADLAWPPGRAFAGAGRVVVFGTDRRAGAALARSLAAAGGPRPEALGKDLALPVRSLAGPGTGSDRLAQALGAAQLLPGRASLVVSAGSALVVDLVDGRGRFRGGLIGLGWGRQREALARLERRLQAPLRPGRPQWPGRTTAEALALGWLLPAAALVRALARRHRAGAVFLTGGDAGLLAPHLPGARPEPHLGADAVARALGFLG